MPTALNVKAEPHYWPAIDRKWWDSLEDFRLMTLDECVEHFETLVGDPEPYMRQLIRVFVDDATLAPSYQFSEDGLLHPVVQALFKRALELKVPHNSFTHWMLTPLPGKNYPRPVAALAYPDRLMEYLADYARNRP
jgi:hypothetical protein